MHYSKFFSKFTNCETSKETKAILTQRTSGSVTVEFTLNLAIFIPVVLACTSILLSQTISYLVQRKIESIILAVYTNAISQGATLTPEILEQQTQTAITKQLPTELVNGFRLYLSKNQSGQAQAKLYVCVLSFPINLEHLNGRRVLPTHLQRKNCLEEYIHTSPSLPKSLWTSYSKVIWTYNWVAF